MKPQEVNGLADPRSVVEAAGRYRDSGAAKEHGTHEGPIETMRVSQYKGHDISVRTTYTIEVDGKPVHGHLNVGNDGQVHYHAIPNLGFPSAIDLVEKLIDAFPDDFESVGAAPAPDHSAHDHSAHGHDGEGTSR